MKDIFIGRQPILDQNMALFAYSLHVDANAGASPSLDREAIQATEALLEKTAQDIGFDALAGDYTTMMNLPEALIRLDCLPRFDQGRQVILELPLSAVKNRQTLENLKQLRTHQFLLALADYQDDAISIKLSTITQFVKLQPNAFGEIKLVEILQSLHDRGIKVIATGVDSEELFLKWRHLGFDYFQGFCFANPVLINGEQLEGNQLTLLQLLAKINHPNTEFDELSQLLSQDVVLSHKLLLAVNNPAAMIPLQVASVADALRYMGLKRLKFWVNMLLLSNIDNTPPILLVSSLVRARFCELMAEGVQRVREKDSFFLVGLLSNLGAFFHLPLADVIEDMPLAEELKQALINQTGLMGQAIALVIQLEQAQTDFQALQFEGMATIEINQAYLQACAWAEQAAPIAT